MDTLKCLFNKIGRELAIKANLLTCHSLAGPYDCGWASRIKGTNWIFINQGLYADYLDRYGEIKQESVWLPIDTIEKALFYVLVHEYTHLIDTPKSRTGLTEDDYFSMLEPLGDRGTVIQCQTKEPSAADRKRQADIHTEEFYTNFRLNVYLCGKILAEIEKAANNQ
ncbi:MAG: hypothetical protein A4E53_01169 [Pelotomaculum sp. PtaB.Bin104]|nr:MAG: hypothetical protein A4E53_01169 [Pelotomaculum sp. PtaB.Bin104]